MASRFDSGEHKRIETGYLVKSNQHFWPVLTEVEVFQVYELDSQDNVWMHLLRLKLRYN